MSIRIFRFYTHFPNLFRIRKVSKEETKVRETRKEVEKMFWKKNNSSQKAAAGKKKNVPTFEIRTDLALEVQESFPGDGGEIKGVSLREWHHRSSHIKLTEVSIMNEQGAKAMGKPVGTYLTLDVPQMTDQDDGYHKEVSLELSKQLSSLFEKLSEKGCKAEILVVGLGNMQVTPDSLGPRVVENLQMTRHLQEEYGKEFMEEKKLPVLSGIVPGVMAQTGMETAEIIKGIVEETKPDIVLAIDALAARSVRRLTTTIQLTDTGIHPGSGVGNHRSSLTKETLGVPVVALGVPMVVGAAAIVHDTVESMIDVLSVKDSTAEYGKYIEKLDPESQYQLIRELLEPEFGPLYVTPQDIDERVRQLSFTISEAIHKALYS